MKHLKGIHDVELIRHELLLAARQAGPRILQVRGVELEAAITGVHPEAGGPAPPAKAEQTAPPAGDDGPGAADRQSDPESAPQSEADSPSAEQASSPKKRKRKSRKSSSKKPGKKS